MTRYATHDDDNGKDVNLNVSKLAVVVAVIASLTAMTGSWFVLPWRVAAAEKAVSDVQTEQRKQNEVLIRIDENVKLLRDNSTQRH
jgi:hypothetical protein